MISYRGNADIEAVLRHMRNKNLSVQPKHQRGLDKVILRVFSLVSKQQARLMSSNGYEIVISEQIVEHPLILRSIRETDRTVLDFGGFESVLPLQLSALGYQVTVLDQRRYPFSHPNMNVVCKDLFASDIGTLGLFDVVLSISTIEHLGLGTYGDTIENDGDRRGVEVLWALVREGGRLLATVPAGKPAVQRGYRVYDTVAIHRVFPHATSVRWFMKEGREGSWLETTGAACGNVVYDKPLSQMPVQAVAYIESVKAQRGNGE